MRSGVKCQIVIVRTWTLLKRHHLYLPLESKILVASSIEVVCTPSLDLLTTNGNGMSQRTKRNNYDTRRKSGDSPVPLSTASGSQ